MDTNELAQAVIAAHSIGGPDAARELVTMAQRLQREAAASEAGVEVPANVTQALETIYSFLDMDAAALIRAWVLDRIQGAIKATMAVSMFPGMKAADQVRAREAASVAAKEELARLGPVAAGFKVVGLAVVVTIECMTREPR